MKGNRTPQQLIADGFSLKPKCPKNIPKKNMISHGEFGTDGKMYHRIERMDKTTQKLFDKSDRMTKQGKQIWYRYEPFTLFFTFAKKYDIDVKKDKRGNVTVIISKAKPQDKTKEMKSQ
jgi:hypothetical protein